MYSKLLRIPLINEECAPTPAKQQRFSPEQADAIQGELKKLAEAEIIHIIPLACIAHFYKPLGSLEYYRNSTATEGRRAGRFVPHFVVVRGHPVCIPRLPTVV